MVAGLPTNGCRYSKKCCRSSKNPIASLPPNWCWSSKMVCRPAKNDCSSYNHLLQVFQQMVACLPKQCRKPSQQMLQAFQQIVAGPRRNNCKLSKQWLRVLQQMLARVLVRKIYTSTFEKAFSEFDPSSLSVTPRFCFLRFLTRCPIVLCTFSNLKWVLLPHYRKKYKRLKNPLFFSSSASAR